MDRFFNTKVAKQSARIFCFVLLCVHAWFVFYFYALGVMPMCRMNVISVFLIFLCFWLIQKSWMDLIVAIVGFDVLVHMVSASYYVGTDGGWHLVLIGMPIAFFYTDYFSLKIRKKTANGVFYSLLYMFGFLIVSFTVRTREPIYSLPDWVNFYTRLVLVILTFLISIILAYAITRHAYSVERNLRDLAQIDALTGLLGRYGLTDQMKQAIREEDLSGCWVALIELQEYTYIRDSYGRLAVDQALIGVADAMREILSEYLCGRWDAERFAVAGCDASGATDKMEQLRQAVSEISMPELLEDYQLKLSIGVATYEQGMCAEDLMEAAEQRLHLAKYNGGNQVV